MNLTGKNKKQFEEWLEKNSEELISWSNFILSHDVYIDEIFNKLPFQMQSGVITDYYDSLGVHIYPTFKHRDGWRFCMSYKTEQMNPYKKYEGYMSCNYDRNEELKGAFKQADKLMNEKLIK